MDGIVTEFPRRVVDDPDLRIVLSDGCVLSARVWMPADALADPVPAVLEYIPYRKRDGTLLRDELMHPYLAGHGYACVRVDMRGNGDSGGLMQDEYTAQEWADACEVIDWLSRQPWCSGRVGMMGTSWGGFNSLQVAALRPPALGAAISVYATVDRFADDIHFKGGALLNENLAWGSVMLSYSSRPADPALRQDWREDWLERLGNQPFLAPRWAGHQARDGYWRHGSVGEDWGAIGVPVLSVGGWADNYMNCVAHLVENLTVPVQGIVGPWQHQYPHTALPGPQIGFLQLAIRWWDRWLKGIDNGADREPAYRAWMLHSQPPDACAQHRAGHWVQEERLPSPRVRGEVWPLSPGVLGGAGGVLDLPVKTPQDLGMRAGEFFPMGSNAEFPGDQRGDDARSVCFDGPVLREPLDLMGAAVLRAEVSADRPVVTLIARLCDVAPDGASVRIAHGILNLCHRADRERPSRLEPGRRYGIDLRLDQMAYRLAPGHRLRLALSTTYWPWLWPAPEAATVMLHEGALELPVHGGSENEWDPPPPEVAPAWKHRVVREGSAARRIETDLIGGTSALVIEEDTGEMENLAHGLVTGESMAERWEIRADDPLSARGSVRWEQRLSRGDWRIRTEAETEMTATGTALRMTARLRAWEGEALVFEREWDESVPREFV
ncbi:MAG: CocE/NonD family hydrolase [Paracoccaceae bacterium]